MTNEQVYMYRMFALLLTAACFRQIRRKFGTRVGQLLQFLETEMIIFLSLYKNGADNLKYILLSFTTYFFPMWCLDQTGPNWFSVDSSLYGVI